ncbi:hypothetical protein BLNAU_15874 [Blattamonas nauphoetae]|uniref:Uncharacterized protein n=1 Tax=Blattamonas nauphoetae TaxID=2049346 RepID=A0ABQ9X997_9EUKA|nr:hypothetical protein BLNAU_15874 [Blattamonas nauphoetae]
MVFGLEICPPSLSPGVSLMNWYLFVEHHHELPFEPNSCPFCQIDSLSSFPSRYLELAKIFQSLQDKSNIDLLPILRLTLTSVSSPRNAELFVSSGLTSVLLNIIERNAQRPFIDSQSPEPFDRLLVLCYSLHILGTLASTNMPSCVVPEVVNRTSIFSFVFLVFNYSSEATTLLPIYTLRFLLALTTDSYHIDETVQQIVLPRQVGSDIPANTSSILSSIIAFLITLPYSLYQEFLRPSAVSPRLSRGVVELVDVIFNTETFTGGVTLDKFTKEFHQNVNKVGIQLIRNITRVERGAVVLSNDSRVGEWLQHESTQLHFGTSQTHLAQIIYNITKHNPHSTTTPTVLNVLPSVLQNRQTSLLGLRTLELLIHKERHFKHPTIFVEPPPHNDLLVPPTAINSSTSSPPDPLIVFPSSASSTPTLHRLFSAFLDVSEVVFSVHQSLVTSLHPIVGMGSEEDVWREEEMLVGLIMTVFVEKPTEADEIISEVSEQDVTEQKEQTEMIIDEPEPTQTEKLGENNQNTESISPEEENEEKMQKDADEPTQPGPEDPPASNPFLLTSPSPHSPLPLTSSLASLNTLSSSSLPPMHSFHAVSMREPSEEQRTPRQLSFSPLSQPSSQTSNSPGNISGTTARSPLTSSTTHTTSHDPSQNSSAHRPHRSSIPCPHCSLPVYVHQYLPDTLLPRFNSFLSTYSNFSTQTYSERQSCSQIGLALKQDGNKSFVASDYATALSLFSSSLLFSPSQPSLRLVALSNATECCLKLGRYEEAVSFGTRALMLSEKGETEKSVEEKVLVRRARALKELGREADACYDLFQLKTQQGRSHSYTMLQDLLTSLYPFKQFSHR